MLRRQDFVVYRKILALELERSARRARSIIREEFFVSVKKFGTLGGIFIDTFDVFILLTTT